MNTNTFDWDPDDEAELSPKLSHAERAYKFHLENPEVYDHFARFAEWAINSGRRVGARMIWERMRWHLYFETTGDTYKINNNFFPWYGRLFMHLNPEREGYFAVRQADSDDFDFEQVAPPHGLTP